PAGTLAAVRNAIELHDDFTLTGLHNVMTLTGSAILAHALIMGRLGADEAWALAHLDEDWQIEQWGEDEEAKLKRAQRKVEFGVTHRFVQLSLNIED
ncbi:MAG: ATPase, partial [Hyphomicrobiales bacterium]